jgi:hypothetical protein
VSLVYQPINMRDKYLSHLVRLTRECREYYHPLDLDFTSCPPEQRAHLVCYERTRDDNYIKERVAFIRTGSVELPSYWSPNPDFGWAEWPELSFLAVPAPERCVV